MRLLDILDMIIHGTWREHARIREIKRMQQQDGDTIKLDKEDKEHE